MIEKRNIQDEYLEKFKSEGKELTVFLTNGFQLRGTIVDFDQYVIDVRASFYIVLMHQAQIRKRCTSLFHFNFSFISSLV